MNFKTLGILVMFILVQSVGTFSIFQWTTNIVDSLKIMGILSMIVLLMILAFHAVVTLKNFASGIFIAIMGLIVIRETITPLISMGVSIIEVGLIGFVLVVSINSIIILLGDMLLLENNSVR